MDLYRNLIIIIQVMIGQKKNISDERLNESSANQIKIFEDRFSTATNHFLPVGPA